MVNDLSGQVLGPAVLARDIQSLIVAAAPAAPAGPPRQLPPAPACFVNRDQERERLRALLDQPGRRDRPAVAVLCGVGGVGKSSVLSAWAHEVRERFADGQLYADLGALRQDGGVEVSDVLGGFLRALGVPEQWIPPSLAERAALFRSRTADRSMLILLDDVEHSAQITPLLPAASGSAVVATSKWLLEEMAVEGAAVLPIAPLTADAGARLLAAMAGAARVEAEPAAVHALVELCGGLPIALRVAGARLAARPSLRVAALLARLADESARLDELTGMPGGVGGVGGVRAIWDAAYHDLPASAARLYRLLAAHPGPSFTLGAAAALAGQDESVAAADVERLRRANLVDEDEQGRLHLHDLLRLHAREHAAADPDGQRDENAALARCVRWYLVRAEAADRTIMGPRRLRLAPSRPESEAAPFASAQDALAWFDAERVNLVWCVRAAAGREWDALCWQLCEPLWVLFLHRKHYADWLTTHRLAVEAATRLDDACAQARMRCQLSRAYLELDRVDDALAEVSAAREAMAGCDLPALAASVLEFTGKARMAAGEHAAAADLFQRSLAVNESINNTRGVALQLYHLGQTLDLTGRHREAIATLERAAALAEELNDARTGWRVATSLGRARLHAGEVESARAALDAAISAAARRGVAHDAALALEVLAEVCAAAGQPELTRRHLAAAADVYAAAGNPRAELVRARLAT